MAQLDNYKAANLTISDECILSFLTDGCIYNIKLRH